MKNFDIRQRLAVIGGAHLEALRRAGTSAMSFQLMGAAILVTSSIAALSMFFALVDAVGVTVLVAIPLALGWGYGVIFTLDRLLITVGMGSGPVSTLSMTLVRVAVAALIGFLVATPLTMRIFQSDIDYQLGVMRVDNAKVIKDKIAKSQEQATVTDLAQQIAEQENVLKGVLPASLSTADTAAVSDAQARVDALEPKLTDAHHASEQASMLFQCDRYTGDRTGLDHPELCSPNPGPNGNAALYQQQAREAAERLAEVQAEYDAARAELRKAQHGQGRDQADVLAQLQAQAPAKLDQLRGDKVDADRALAALTDHLNEKNEGNDGLLASLEALSKASAESPTLRWAHWLLAALFWLIEVLPVLAKVMFGFGKRAAAYEQVLALIEGTELHVAHQERMAWAEVEQRRIVTRRDREFRLIQESSDFIEQEQRAQLVQQLDDWAAAGHQAVQVSVPQPGRERDPVTAAQVDVDRAVLACVVDPATDLVDARERLDCWLWDRPEVADFLDVVLVHGGPLPSASLELVLAAAGPLLPGHEEAAREQVALVVVAPAADFPAFAEAVHACGPLGAVVLTLAEHDDPVAAVAATCAHVLDLASRQVLPALTHLPEETTVTDPVPAPSVVDEGPAPVPAPWSAPAPAAPIRLLYVVWLGQTPHPGRRRAQRRWVERVLDTIAERSGDHVVRLVGLGNGLSDQSDLAPAAEFRSVRRLRRRQHGWPRVHGVLDLDRAGHDLDTLLERDLERVAYEGLPVLDRSVVVVVGEAPVAGQGVADAFAGLAASVRLLWVAPERPSLALPTMFEAPPGAERLTEHRELDEEVVRKLGLLPRSSLGERLDGPD